MATMRRAPIDSSLAARVRELAQTTLSELDSNLRYTCQATAAQRERERVDGVTARMERYIIRNDVDAKKILNQVSLVLL